jgi:hypothetical protein
VPDAAPFLEHQQNVRLVMETLAWPAVMVPYAEHLAALLVQTGTIGARLKRDFKQLITLIQTHTILHFDNRDAVGNPR